MNNLTPKTHFVNGLTENSLPQRSTPNTIFAKSAIRLAVVHNLSIFRLWPDLKTPATTHGLNDSSNDDAHITAEWTQTPNANIGLNCGASGLVALDFDVNKADFAGGDLLDALRKYHPTVESETQSGGPHLIYMQPDGVELGNSSGNLPKGVDVRGHGGYIVLPPSRLDPDRIDEKLPDSPEREAKRNLYRQRTGYRWVQGRAPGEINFAPLPDFVLKLIQQPKAAKQPTKSQESRNRPSERTETPEVSDYIRRVKEAWPTKKVFQHFGRDTKGIVQENRDEERILGNGGLLVNDWKWFCHTDDVGGDNVDAWSYCRWGKVLDRSNPKAFWDTINDMAAEAGIEQPARKAPQAVQSDTVQTTSLDVQAEQLEEEINPLDVTPVKGLKLGWIDDYTKLMEDLTSSPAEFHQLAALVTVASVLQRRAWLPMSFGNIYPNIYGCIIAPSTVFAKSTSITAPRRVLQSAMMENLVIPAQGSSEGLIKQLSTTSSALMIRDEIGTLFGSDKVKYLKDYKQDLTAIYDCSPYSRILSSGEIKVDRPYLNILGATTPTRFYNNVNRNDWLDGFLPRWLFVQPEGEPNFDSFTGMFNHDGAISNLAWRLMEIDKRKDTAFTLQGESAKMCATWRKKSLEAAYQQNDEIAMAIIGRYATYALKFAIILAAVNNSWGTVTEETMQTAIILADNYKHGVNRILCEREKHEISGGKLQKVFLLLRSRSGEVGLTSRDIQQLTNMSKTEVEQVLDRLQQIAAIYSKKNTAKNRRTITTYHPAVKDLPVKNYGQA